MLSGRSASRPTGVQAVSRLALVRTHSTVTPLVRASSMARREGGAPVDGVGRARVLPRSPLLGGSRTVGSSRRLDMPYSEPLQIGKIPPLPAVNVGEAGNELLRAYEAVVHSTDLQSPLRRDLFRTNADPNGIFATNEFRMDQMKVIGVDYDYTICHYSEDMPATIYSLALDRLIDVMRYPSICRSLPYDPDFSVRGVVFDSRHGLLTKMNSLNHISVNATYRGRRRLSAREVQEIYNGKHVSTPYAKQHMRPMTDLFSKAEACLVTNILELMNEKGIAYEPVSVSEDCRKVISMVHKSGLLHETIMADLPRYLEKSPQLVDLLERFRSQGKKLFLLTNSPFRFVDAGLKYLLGKQWREHFDIIIVNSRKPSFYSGNMPFRVLDTNTLRNRWDAVTSLQRGKVYTNGNLSDLMRLTGWSASQVLYLGDHLFADLAEPTRMKGWTTGAIIRELKDEITVQNGPEYQILAGNMLLVEQVLRLIQNLGESIDPVLLDALEAHRKQFRIGMGILLNPYFGSVFRTEGSTSMFAFSVRRYADVYTSQLENFADVPARLYSEFSELPHEPRPNLELLSRHITSLATSPPSGP